MSVWKARQLVAITEVVGLYNERGRRFALQEQRVDHLLMNVATVQT